MRPPSAAAPAATSATGARFTFTPSSRSLVPAPRASARTSAGGPCSDCAGSGPANGRLRTSPPSWSTATRAPPCAARWSERVSARHSAGPPPFLPNTITPGGLARAQPARQVGGHRRAVEARDEQLAHLLPQRQRVHGRRGACALAGRFAGGVAARAGAHGHARGQRQGRGGRERHQPAARGRIARQPHATASRRSTGTRCGAPVGSSAMPAWRQPSTSASRPNASAGPSAPTPSNRPAAACSAPHAMTLPVNVYGSPPVTCTSLSSRPEAS